jgi:hypothetical protein
MKSLVPKRYESIFVYSRKTQSVLNLLGNALENISILAQISRWFEQLGYNLTDL